MDSIDRIIGRIAAPQAGTFTAQQAIAAGIPASALHRRARRGALLVPQRGVYFAGAVLTLEAARWCAVLGGGQGARLGGAAAEDDWGIARYPNSAVEIVVPGSPRRMHDVAVLRTTTLHPEDCRTNRGRPTTSVERVLVDVAARRTIEQLTRSLREADFRNLLDPDRMQRTIDRNRNRRGVGRLRRAVSRHLHGHGGADSSFEDRFARMLHRAGIGDFITGFVIRVGGEVLRVDVYVPELDLVIEVNPDGHLKAPMTREDKLRAALCRLAGHDLLVVPGNDLAWGVQQVVNRLSATRRRSRTPRAMRRT